MSVQEFWHEDVRLFRVYEQAYYNNMSYNAWLNGKYTFMAVQLGVNNALASKKSERVDFPDYKAPFEPEEEKVTKDNLEDKHRNLMAENAEWLKSLLGKKGV